MFMTNPKSKYKVQVKFDDWVFIKIVFSNHPIQPPPKTTEKASNKLGLIWAKLSSRGWWGEWDGLCLWMGGLGLIVIIRVISVLN